MRSPGAGARHGRPPTRAEKHSSRGTYYERRPTTRVLPESEPEPDDEQLGELEALAAFDEQRKTPIDLLTERLG